MKNPTCFAAVIIALSGCAHFNFCELPSKPIRPTPPKVCRQIDITEPIDLQEACPSWRRVAIKTNPEGACPNPGAVVAEREGVASEEIWTVGHLFAVDAPSADRASAETAASLPPALRPFCLYEYKKNAPETLVRLNEKLNFLVSGRTGPLVRVDDACAGVGPAAEKNLTDSSWQKLETYFLNQVGAVEPVARLGNTTAATVHHKPGVRLSFLDTQPANEKSAGKANTQHGYTLAQIAREMVCDSTPDERCAAEIDYRLALPIESFDRHDPEKTKFDQEFGGYSGSVDLLAAAVWDAVRNQQPSQRLVLNLSVAWDGAIFGGLEREVADMPATVQAMYRALEVANCHGALVIAAAGNRRGGPDTESGPLLPGGWEQRDAPNAATCSSILGRETEARRAHSVAPEPLVYAAGGVRFDNSPLYNARPGGIPPRVAYANHALVLPKGDGSATEARFKPMTGSSVAATVISATASVVWHHWPHLSPAEVMDLLERGGEQTAHAADFYHRSYSPPPEVRRVGLCTALKQACTELGGSCPASSCERPNGQVAWTLETPSCSYVKKIDARKITKKFELSFCNDRTVLYDPQRGIPYDPCPTRQFYGANAWAWQESTLPQPEEDPCSACGPGGGGETQGSGFRLASLKNPTSTGRSLWIQIADDWRTEKTLNQTFLDIGDSSLALGVGELRSGDCVLVEHLDIDAIAGPQTHPEMILRFRTNDRRVISVPVPFGDSEPNSTTVVANQR